MKNNDLKFKIAMPLDQKEDFLRALDEQRKESEIEESDLIIAEGKQDSQFRDLYFDPALATMSVYVFDIIVAGVSSWIISKALDRFFGGRKPDTKIQDLLVVVLMPDGELENLNPKKVDKLREALERIKVAK